MFEHFLKFVGENGSGKSTLLEALAVAHGFNPEGGTKNYVFSTHDTHSELCDAIRIARLSEGKVGIYILHPNNVGRCGHIANASFAVGPDCRGQHIGEKLVLDCLAQAKLNGFGILQFDAVVEKNVHARHLYERLGFVQIGMVPKGFRMKDGTYQNICLYYHEV